MCQKCVEECLDRNILVHEGVPTSGGTIVGNDNESRSVDVTGAIKAKVGPQGHVLVIVATNWNDLVSSIKNHISDE